MLPQSDGKGEENKYKKNEPPTTGNRSTPNIENFSVIIYCTRFAIDISKTKCW